MRSSIAVLFCLFLCSGALAQESPLRVGTITVTPLDVYSHDEAKRGWLYLAADRLHRETRESVVRKFLLFHEGEVYRPERLAETERNLRALHFLKAARVTASAPHDGVVDVLVVTQDAWSIAPETQAGSKGGTTTYGVTISEGNLLGLGREVSFTWNKTVDRKRVGIDYQDPAINANYWNSHVTYLINSDGHDRALALRRPFYSFSTPWATTLQFENVRQDDRLYTDGVLTSRFRDDSREAIASYGIALAPNDTDANRISGGLHLVQHTFENRLETGGIVPAERDYRYLFARFDHAENDFMTLNFVNKDLRYEDFDLGREYSFTAGVSPRLLGGDTNSLFASTAMSDGVRLGATTFLMPALAVESRFDGGAKNAIATASMNFVHRSGTAHPSATVARVLLTNGWRLDRDVQFAADGDTGLRAYRLHEFTGSRVFIANLEQRFYLGREILQLASPGLVAFIDSGNATEGGLASLARLKTDVGVGIRIGLPRTPKNLLRIDFAFPLNRGNFGRRGLEVSFSSGQAF